jgi:hypothetical protein
MTMSKDDDNEEDGLYFETLLMIAKGNDKFLTLAANLRKLYDTAPEEFRRLAKLRILGRRRAYYFVEIDRVFGGDQDMAVRLNRIGWTKLQIIAPYVTKENREELVALAEAHTAVNLKAIMRGKPPILGGRTVVLHFTKKQFAAFAEAILAHGATKNGAGFLDKERALTKALKKRKKKGDTKIPGASESGSSGCDLA